VLHLQVLEDVVDEGAQVGAQELDQAAQEVAGARGDVIACSGGGRQGA
jgi:hypothetical protein